MTNQIDWVELFFSAAGRVARGPFLIATGVLVAIVALFESIVGSNPLQILTGWIVYPLVLFCAACVLSKRLHDRGRSGWWAAIILAAMIAVWPQPDGFFDFLFSIVLVWAAVELGALAGEQGSNRFGANPLRPVQA